MITLVDENDKVVGKEEKLEAHKKGLLHRAFSIFIFNKKGELLLQKREKSKYHCGSLWTNTCCSHPRYGEELENAIHRRIVEEMGFDCEMKKVFNVTYKAFFDNGLTEHEFDHVFIGFFEGKVSPNPEEVEEYKWETLENIVLDVKENPSKYTPWFRIIIEEHLEKIQPEKRKITF